MSTEPGGNRVIAVTIDGGAAGVRADTALLAKLRESGLDLSRSQLQGWIAAGAVVVNGAALRKPAALLKGAVSVVVTVPPPAPSTVSAEEIPLPILFEDEVLLVINKPAGIAMHPGAGRASGTVANAIAGHIAPDEFAEDESIADRPGIVHRLDFDTSGVVVVAKTLEAQRALSAQFAEKSTDRRYQALVFTTPRSSRAVSLQDSGTVATQIGRHPRRRKEMAVVASGGRHAVTHWQVLERFAYGALIELRLETGRTHQIRVHMQHLHSPVIGDQVYGDDSGLPSPLRAAAQHFQRQALHARTLGFTHPVTGKRMQFEAPPSADFLELVAQFRKGS